MLVRQTFGRVYSSRKKKLIVSLIYLISLGLGRCSVSILSFLSSELLELKLSYSSILCFSALEHPDNSSHNAVKLFDSVCILLK